MKRQPTPPSLVFGPDGAPESATFGDVYFARGGGLAESEAVFLAGCGLPDAWAGQSRFTIGELGFGTGLNALAVWRAWRATRHQRPAGAVLHFFTVEAHPMSPEDTGRALAAFPEVSDLSAALLARWPAAAFGSQRLWFEADGFCLTVLVGDAEQLLAGLEGRFDAWFLDGFAPSCNPEMWSPALLARIAALSAPGARLATYSTAGHVRRNLQTVGFAVEKKPGFGAKRERLEARFSGEPIAAPRPPARLAVLGSGIAGASIAAAARRRGLDAIILDAAPDPGAGASGNPAALLMPRLDRAHTGLSRLFLAAYLFALDAYRGLGQEAFSPCGVIEIPRPGRAEALADLLADPPLPDALFAPHTEGALHRQAGLVRPAAALSALIGTTPVLYRAAVKSLHQQGPGWALFSNEGAVLAQSDAVVLANGPGLNQFDATRFLPIEWSRGQIEWGATTTPQSGPARAGGPYAAPFGDGVLFGATFDRLAALDPATPDAKSRQQNLESLNAIAPDWAQSLLLEPLASRASIRAAMPDRAPIAGPIPDASTASLGAPIDRLAGLYLLGGLGARGFLLAPLLGETVVSALMGETAPLDAEALAAIDPARFLLRALRRMPR